MRITRRQLFIVKKPLLLRRKARFWSIYRAVIVYAGTRANTYVRVAANTFEDLFTAGRLDTFQHKKKKKRSYLAGVELGHLVSPLLTSNGVRRCVIDCRGRQASRKAFLRTLFSSKRRLFRRKRFVSPRRHALAKLRKLRAQFSSRNRSKRSNNRYVVRRLRRRGSLNFVPLAFVDRTAIAHNGTRPAGKRRL